jgi:nitroreductase
VPVRNGYRFMPLAFERLAPVDQIRRAREFESQMLTRRTVRRFSPQTVDRQLIEAALRVASRSPSGANQQPWTFVAISAPDIKRKIRLAAETEEKQNYEGRFPQEWLDALAPLETDWHKEFLEIAPWLVAPRPIDYTPVKNPRKSQSPLVIPAPHVALPKWKRRTLNAHYHAFVGTNAKGELITVRRVLVVDKSHQSAGIQKDGSFV